MSSKAEIARYLAESHFEVEDGLTHVFRLYGTPETESHEAEPIKLLEVHEGTVQAGILPLFFSRTRNVPFPSVIIEVTPDEFERIKSQELKLPNDWTIGESLPRPVLEQAG